MFLLGVVEADVDALDRVSVGQLAGHERAVRPALHQFRPAVAAQLAETVVTVDRRVVDHTRVRQQEAAVCNCTTHDVVRLICPRPLGGALSDDAV